MSHTNFKKYLSKNVVDAAQSLGGLTVAGLVITNTLTSAVEVGAGNIIRITITAVTDVAFGDSTVIAPSGGVGESSVRLPSSAEQQVHYVLATGDYIRTSAVVLHAEVIKV